MVLIILGNPNTYVKKYTILWRRNMGRNIQLNVLR